MPRTVFVRSMMIIIMSLPFIGLPQRAQGRGGLGGFHGEGFHLARVGGIRPPRGELRAGGVTGLRLPSGALPSRMHVLDPHPMSIGGFGGYRPSAGAGRYYAGGYGGIHTGGYLTGERYARVHYRPSAGFYHPYANAAGVRTAAEHAAAWGNAYNYYSTYYNMGGISPSYVADPYYNPYQGLYSDPVP